MKSTLTYGNIRNPEIRVAVEAANQFIRTEGIPEQKARIVHLEAHVPSPLAISTILNPLSIPLRLRIRQSRPMERFATLSTEEWIYSMEPDDDHASIHANCNITKSQKKSTSPNTVQHSDFHANVSSPHNLERACRKISFTETQISLPKSVGRRVSEMGTPSTSPKASDVLQSKSNPQIIPKVPKSIQSSGPVSVQTSNKHSPSDNTISGRKLPREDSAKSPFIRGL